MNPATFFFSLTHLAVTAPGSIGEALQEQSAMRVSAWGTVVARSDETPYETLQRAVQENVPEQFISTVSVVAFNRV